MQDSPYSLVTCVVQNEYVMLDKPIAPEAIQSGVVESISFISSSTSLTRGT